MFFPESGLQLHLPEKETTSMAERIHSLHRRLRSVAPVVDRMACALYDPGMDLLKTFVNSTDGGEPLKAYQYRLSESPSLKRLAENKEARVLGDIRSELTGTAEHTLWVRAQGYRSSYTMPLFHQNVFEGFLFFDSRTPGAFTPEVVSKLEVYGQLVMLMISHEVTAIQTLVGSVRVARDFAHLRDVETGTHLDRMSRYARMIARGLASSHHLDDEFIEHLFLFSPLHDIGKVGIPDAVLLKPGRFTPSERTVMMRHVDLGGMMIERLVRDFNLSTVAGIEILRNVVSGHHEFLDGSGYPKGLKADQIPMEARIVTVADIFDALTSKRTYKDAWDIEDAFATLDSMASEGKLDTDCVRALRAGSAEISEIITRYNEHDEGAIPTPA